MITAQVKISQKPKVIVAGGAGFIGSFLCETLLLQKCQVVCIDNLSTGKKENLERCFLDRNFTFIRYDLSKSLSGIMVSQVDYIFDLAGCEFGTKNLLSLAEKYSAKILTTVSVGKASFHKSNANFRIVRLLDVYGPRMNLKSDRNIVQLIKGAIDGSQIIINEGSYPQIFPVFIADAIYGLTKIMFSSGMEGEVIDLINREKINISTFVLELEKLTGRELNKKYLSQKGETNRWGQNEFFKGKSDFNWKPKVKISEGLQQTLAFFKKQKKPSLAKPTKKTEVGKVSPKRRKPLSVFLVTLLLVLGLLSLPVISLFFNLYWGTNNLIHAKQAIIEANFLKATDYSKNSHRYLKRAANEFRQLSTIFSLIGGSRLMGGGEKLFYLEEEIAHGLVHICSASEKGSSLIAYVFQAQNQYNSEPNLDITRTLAEINTELDQSYNSFSSIEAELKQENDSIIRVAKLFRIQGPIKSAIDLLPQARKLILQAKEGIQLTPSIVGLEQKKTYLVLLQNSAELRPTGGFIGSFALVTLEQGRLIDIEIQDVYWADGQLKGHVEPPPELKKYLGEANWYLRDSNWSPDFPTSARKAVWFLEKETGRAVDGVIGIDLFVIQRLLKATGEIEIPDYREKISATNLFERAEFYSEVGFFPGSTQKQDFLGSLSRALFERIKNTESKVWLNIVKEIYRSLKAKDLIVYLGDSQKMAIVSSLDWDGRIRDLDCRGDLVSCVMDYLMIVESNVGVNKANYFVTRKLSHQVRIGVEGEIKNKLLIVYENSSPTEIFPGGRYRNYLRVLTPLGSRLEEITIDGQKINEEEIDRGTILSKTSFGFLIEVPTKEQVTVEVAYLLPQKISLLDKSQYLLLLQRQPGTKEEKFPLEFIPPPGVVILSAKPEVTLTKQAYFFNPDFVQDIIFEITLAR